MPRGYSQGNFSDKCFVTNDKKCFDCENVSTRNTKFSNISRKMQMPIFMHQNVTHRLLARFPRVKKYALCTCIECE